MADSQRQAEPQFWNHPELERKFDVDRVLGSGGMGVVILARQKDLDRPVAIKFLHPQVLEDPEPVSRFLREGRASAQLRSEHVCRVLDVGELPEVGPYLVMEYLQGQDLETLVRERGKLPVGEAVSLVLQACEAIAEAHSCGIVHRDLKPSNLFLTHDAFGAPCVKVLDFGISKMDPSKIPGGAQANLTRSNALVGSPLYMPPEQLQAARHADARADIWSLGCILYELLAGHPVWLSEKIHEVLTSILSATPPKLRDERPDVPESLEKTILTCLQKAPADRFDNVSQLAARLAPHADASGTQSIQRLARGVPVVREHPERAFEPRAPTVDVLEARSNQSTLDAPIADPRSPAWLHDAARRRKVAGMLGALAVVVVGVAAIVFFRSSGRTADRPQEVSAASEAVAPEAAPGSLAAEPNPSSAPIASVAPQGSLPPPEPASAEPITSQDKRRPPSPRHTAPPAPPVTHKPPAANTAPANTAPTSTPPANKLPIYDGGRY